MSSGRSLRVCSLLRLPPIPLSGEPTLALLSHPPSAAVYRSLDTQTDFGCCPVLRIFQVDP